MSDRLKQLSDATFDDIMQDPTKFGMPTFDEFAKNPETLLGREDERLTEVERGSVILGKTVKRYIYEIEGYRCKTLQEVERVALSMGINLKELDYQPQMETNTSGKFDIKVKFVSKAERAKRQNW
ncbi:hypothetical protein EBZ39_11125 [bacterium]|nr:hypothetical protein [bacterium]